MSSTSTCEQLPHAIDASNAARRLEEWTKSDLQLAAAAPDPRVSRVMRDPSLSYRQVITCALSAYEDRPALGARTYTVEDGARRYFKDFTTIIYAQLACQAEAISCAWRFDDRFFIKPGEFAACIVFSGAEYAAIDIGCVYSQVVSVPIQANLAPDVVAQIITDIAPATIVVSIDYLSETIGYALRQDTVRSIIVINADLNVSEESALINDACARLGKAKRQIALATFAELVNIGKPYEYTHLPAPVAGRDALSMLMYTSGSTGTPKGAQIHEGMCIMFWAEVERPHPMIIVADAPVNHWMGRVEIINALSSGGTCYFTLKPDLSTFVEDVQTVRPTFMNILPRFAETVYQSHSAKLQHLVSTGIKEAEADVLLRKELKNCLGDRLAAAVIGSSPTPTEVKQFFRDCFQLSVTEGYGSTEASGGATTVANYVNRQLVIDYKLRDVPELGYYTADRPHPRGELLVKTRHQFKGYFKRPEATASVFDSDGYVITGDIMEERGRDHLVWLDRRNNVIKLAQAEFVAITPLESTFLADNPIVTQIYLYGSSYRSFLLAVVVPDVQYAHEVLGHDPSDDEMRALVLQHLQGRARAASLKSFEVPRNVLIERESFTYENGLLSSVRKALRPKLKERYGGRLEAMYDDMDRRRQHELIQLRDTTGGRETVGKRVFGAFKASLSLQTVDPLALQSYRDLGGDSLGAMSLNQLLAEMFDVSVPVSLLLSPQGSIEKVTKFIKQSISGSGKQPQFQSVHGKNPIAVSARDIVLPAFLNPETLNAALHIAPYKSTTRTVLLTGATGFLGRFLCLQWMEKLAGRKGKVIAIVRARDASTARTRVDEAIGSADPSLSQRFKSLAREHLDVISGDFALPFLGQTAADFARLSNEVDHIVHAGALVNHRLSYADLFEPNVVGTAELIRLALTGHQKRFDYISTVGVPYANPRLRDANEDADVRVQVTEMRMGDSYAIGYSTSKWASEVLLRDAHERFDLAVNVFRPNMILAHSTYFGQINVPDMFTRLLLSIIITGLAPASFYRQHIDGGRPKTHYDGTPVDVLARVMQDLGDSNYHGFHTYNTINMHAEDGVSLDSFVDWIESAGFRVTRVADYDEWYSRFKSKLLNLPEPNRQRSLLSIVGHYEKPHSVDTSVVSSRLFEEAVGRHKVPSITEGFIHKYLRDMKALGLLCTDSPGCT